MSGSRIIDSTIKNLRKTISTGDILASHLHNLKKEDQETFLSKLGSDHIRAIITTGEQLAQCLQYLSDENSKTLVGMLGTHKQGQVKELINSGTVLVNCLERLDIRKQIYLIELLRSSHLRKIVTTSDVLRDCLKNLDEKKHWLYEDAGETLLEMLGKEHISSIIANNKKKLLEFLRTDEKSMRFIPFLSVEFFRNISQNILRLSSDRKENDTRNNKTSYNDILTTRYYQNINTEVFERILNEVERLRSLPDDSAQEKAAHLLQHGAKLKLTFIQGICDAINGNPSHSTKQVIDQVNQTLVRDVRALAQNDAINVQRNPVAAFFKKILGILISPWLSESNHRFFFKTKTSYELHNIANDFQAQTEKPNAPSL